MEQQTAVSSSPSGVERWRKATASNATGSCVELGACDGGIAMRNSRDPDGPALVYTREEIAAFIHGVKCGEFDDLIAPS
ncbi:DUF397 domain-containing protein [Pseudonocardia sp.]|uniref:DUF397 domain-containing protein n=1 Tax=Pseudonocardia sp. TaxID=60912 RepID=UPI003D0E3242